FALEFMPVDCGEAAGLANSGHRTLTAYLARAVAGLHAGENPQSLTPKALRKQLPKAKAV
ncbi:MAG: hypothetical protein PF961_11380, partial [Planctomycetota bacterium]|nr:hypothetical protein [Planctomycetota bacterium]